MWPKLRDILSPANTILLTDSMDAYQILLFENTTPLCRWKAVNKSMHFMFTSLDRIYFKILVML